MCLDTNPCRRVSQSNRSWCLRAVSITGSMDVTNSNAVIILDNHDESPLKMKNSVPGWECTYFIHICNSKIVLSRSSQISSGWHCRTCLVCSSGWSHLWQLALTRCLRWTIALPVVESPLSHSIIKIFEPKLFYFLANLNDLQCICSVNSPSSIPNLYEYHVTRFEYNILLYNFYYTLEVTRESSYEMVHIPTVVGVKILLNRVGGNIQKTH